MSPEVLLTMENLRMRRLIRFLIIIIVIVPAEDEDVAEPSRSYTDVGPTYEEVEHWPDSSELEADEAGPLLVEEEEDQYL